MGKQKYQPTRADIEDLERNNIDMEKAEHRAVIHRGAECDCLSS